MQKKITKIVAQKRKGRYNVYLNGYYAFPISESVMIKYRIFKGMTIDDELKQRLINADSFSKLYNYAINYLSHHLRTEKEIKDYLIKRIDDLDVIKQIINKLKKQRLVDDQNYANSYVRSQVREVNKGPLSIQNNLKQKGIKDNIISLALNNYFPNTKIIENGLHQANKLFKHHTHDAFNLQYRKVQKGLVRKGYSFSDVTEIMDQINIKPDVEKQKMLINRKGMKYWNKYKNLSISKRKFKTKQFLYRKGFNLDDIDEFLFQLY